MTPADTALARAPLIAVRRAPFDPATIAIHWTSVLLVAGLFILGWSMDLAGDAASAARLLTAHRSIGVAVWMLSLGRAVWRRTGAFLPPFPARMPPAQRLAARLNEYALYALLLTQPVTGVLQTLYRGKPFDLFIWRVPALAARDKGLVRLFHQVHEWGAWALAGVIVLHAAAALFHALVLRDGVFHSMAPRRSHGRSGAR